MKQIRMITFHTPKNYGAVLQAYGLMTCFRKLSDNVMIIDYDTEHLRSIYPILPKPYSVKSFIKYCIMLPRYSAIKSKYKKFEEFKKKHLHLTKRFESTDELYKEDWGTDVVFCTGSDQVFNPNRIIDERKAFFLDFVPERCQRISYAASLGVPDIPRERIDEIKLYLSRFNNISIRETSGADVVSKLTNRKVPVVVDPVFLCQKNEWDKIIAPYHRKFENYLLYYKVLNNHDSEYYARKIANEKQLNLVIVTQNPIKIKSDAVLYDVGPQELLGLIDNSSFVVTDAFHGVALSIIFNKQFVFADRGRTNNRGIELLQTLGIKDQSYCESYDNYSQIDYKNVNGTLEKMVRYSIQYLEEALEASNDT